MPGLNGTGPLGQGSRTGGGFGVCPPGAGPGAYAPVYGVGRGGIPRGGGMGRARVGGRGWWGRVYSAWRGFSPASYYGPAPAGADPADEAGLLRQRVVSLEEELQAVRERLRTMESGSAT